LGLEGQFVGEIRAHGGGMTWGGVRVQRKRKRPERGLRPLGVSGGVDQRRAVR
jgi:hypothetical protein